MDGRRLGDGSPGISYDAALIDPQWQTVRAVYQTMRGQHADKVHAVLVHQLEGRFPGVDFDPGQLRWVAGAIARGTSDV